MKRFIVLIFAVCLVLFSFIRSTPVHAISASDFCMDAEESKFLGLINDYRASHSLPALKLTKTLGAAAEHHSVDMATYNYFTGTHYLAGNDHISGTSDDISWSTNIISHGYPTNYGMGENLAAGTNTAADALTGWKGSPAHNTNMLDATWRAIGVGRAYNANSTYKWYWTTDFATFVDTSAPPLCSSSPTPVPVPTTAPTPTNYVRIPYSSTELSSGTTVNQWKNSLIYIKKNMNLNMIGFYNTGAGAQYEIRNSESTGSLGTVIKSGTLKTSPLSSNYYYQDISVNLNAGTYYVVRVFPTTGRYYYGSSSTYYTELSFLRRSNATDKVQTTGAFQLRLRFTLR